MGLVYRIYFYALLSFLLFILFDDFHFNIWWYLIIYLFSVASYNINDTWFSSRTIKQTLLIIISTFFIAAVLYIFGSFSKYILLIAAFLLFIFSGVNISRLKNANQKNIEYQCKNCNCINQSKFNEFNKLEVRKCNHCNYYNYFKVDESLNVTMVRSTSSAPTYLNENIRQTLSTKQYSLILTIIVIISFFISK